MSYTAYTAEGQPDAELPTMKRFIVWGCGAWRERRRIVPEDEPTEIVTDATSELHRLPEAFLREWGENLGSEHWAEILTCEEGDLDAATRFAAAVQGWMEV